MARDSEYVTCECGKVCKERYAPNYEGGGTFPAWHKGPDGKPCEFRFTECQYVKKGYPQAKEPQ